MLQPGTCSAMRSSSSTCVGPPGARAMHCAIGGSSARHDVRSAGADDVRGEERLDEERQPVAIDARVGVGVGDDLAGGVGEADVARRAQPAVRGVDDAHARMAAARSRSVRSLRAVVDEDDLVVGIGQPLERAQAVFERVGGVVGADDDRDARPRLLRARAGNGASANAAATAAAAGFGRRSRSTRPNAQSSTGVAAAPPFVGPRERHRAARAFLERGADVHRGDRRLAVFAFADAVGARFGEQQRLVAGDVLQPREVGAQLGFAVQVDVERADVEEREIEKLGRRKVDVGEQAVRRRGLRVVVEVAQEALDAQPAVPADDAGRNLVAEREQSATAGWSPSSRTCRRRSRGGSAASARDRRGTRRAATTAARPSRAGRVGAASSSRSRRGGV